MKDSPAIKCRVPGRVSPKSETKNLFGPQLKKLRLARGLTATKVIAQLGVLGWEVGHSTFSSLEAGRRMLADTELTLILRVLQATLADLRIPKGKPPKQTPSGRGQKSAPSAAAAKKKRR